MDSIVLHVAVPSPLYQHFDYLPLYDLPGQYQPGMRVQVPFGRQSIVGVITAVSDQSSFPREKLKSIQALVDETPLLSVEMLQLCHWASDYYHHPLGEVIAATLPKALREGRALSETPLAISKQQRSTPLALNTEQQHAVDAVLAAHGFAPFVLAGVTGSGKTEVYLQLIAAKLALGLQALVLVPEISLTPQTVARFASRFAEPIALLHSGLTDKQRLIAWSAAARGEARIVIGTRSAVFAPMPHCGLIILDEEHDQSFKQQSGFRYSARDLAVVRAKNRAIPLVLGSATPSLETLYNVKRQRYQRLSLTQRAGQAVPPTMQVLDLRNKDCHEGLSDELIQIMQEHLQQQGQVLLFLNRRGFAPILLCHHCGWVSKCARCDARMTLHVQPRYLLCHHCHEVQIPPRICPHCHQGELITLGLGTERIEQTLQKLFPLHNTIRIDRDSTTRKGSLEKMLAQMHSGEAHILVGTQMVAKGHHFRNLTLVAIVDADTGLFSSDFRATEKMAQLLMQVAGRAGREQRQGQVLVQTHQPDHPLLVTLLEQGYDAFAEKVFAEREATGLPPYSHLALIRADAKKREYAMAFLQEAKQLIVQSSLKEFLALGPVPALMERKAERFHAQLLLQSMNRRYLQQQLRPVVQRISQLPHAKKVRWSLDVDPQDVL